MVNCHRLLVGVFIGSLSESLIPSLIDSFHDGLCAALLAVYLVGCYVGSLTFLPLVDVFANYSVAGLPTSSFFHQQLSLRFACRIAPWIARGIVYYSSRRRLSQQYPWYLARRSACRITRRIARQITHWSARRTTHRIMHRSGHITSTEQVTKPRNGHSANVAITTENGMLSELRLPEMSPGNAG